MRLQAGRGSFDLWNNDNENILKMRHVEDITRCTDRTEEITDNNLYALNKEMGYDTEITTDVEKKVITDNGKIDQLKILLIFKKKEITLLQQKKRRMY
jgi:hypothetical protein